MEDNYIHKGKRRQLVNLLREKGITDERVLDAINEVPRHLFLDSGFLEHAYQNKAFPIGAGQTISHPYTVAFQSQLLEVMPGQRILEIGTGSGYQCAVLIKMKAQVYTIERQNELYKKTTQLFKKLFYRPRKFVFGDGYKGLPDQGPFDGIIVTCGATDIPKALLAQLKIGGRMVIPVGDDSQIMTLIIRESESKFVKSTFGEFRFVPFLDGKE
ncbi:protein-L-isoaspartate O-methyltransferase [Nonlabens sp. MIC269]|nr:MULTISPECIES: protein-L-isoaspartate(D-aspartate) O-methyltransferase [Nonlabens]ALM19981.1 protein-L-isoaspartate O-methyltransferase [Nonlabens sp. MIC269]ARN70983.1 protein-L-isoaspartate O-methyltransferase [Nonlabens tegetincola]MEE2802181.1 protein-L-isoaspartate(D-aspartate) O-methyltransferase [Bacteroidota bacterium]PQJ18639.1 protein-L-isoaspartate O-methyltransferase [Nonlabens tegetincola]